MISFLFIAFIVALVLVVAGIWIVFSAIAATLRMIARTVNLLLGGGHRHRDRVEPREHCANDRCNAPWRKEARFCHRCGEPRHANLPAFAGPRAA